MTKTRRRQLSRRELTGVALIVAGIILMVVPFGLGWYVRALRSQPVGGAAPLNPLEREAVHRQRAFAATLPAAFAEIPLAMADAKAAGGSQAEGRQLLEQNRQLAGLARVVQNPGMVVTPLTRALGAADVSTTTSRFPSDSVLLLLFGVPALIAVGSGVVVLSKGGQRRRLKAARIAGGVAGVWLVVFTLVPVQPGQGSLVHEAAASTAASKRLQAPLTPGGPAVGSAAAAQLLQTDLAVVQNVYADIVPAMQAAAAESGRTLSAADTGQVIRSDSRLADLQRLVRGLSGLYGAGVLAVQASTAHEGAVQTATPLLVLPVFAIAVALMLLILAWLVSDRGAAGSTGARGRRRTSFTSFPTDLKHIG